MSNSLPDLDARPETHQAPPAPASRRAVLAGAAGLSAVAAVTVITAGSSLPSLGADRATAPVADPAAQVQAGSTIVAVVRAGSLDQVTLHSGDRDVVVTDRTLVQAIIAGLNAGKA